MKLSVEFIASIIPNAKLKNISVKLVFDWIDVVYIRETPNTENLVSVLWCVIYTAQDVGQDGWCDAPFDRRIYVEKVITDHSDWVFLTDDSTLGGKFPGSKLIVVSDVIDSLEKLHLAVLELVRPKVVGVTGSVGKTTTVALIEDMLLAYNKQVLRLYAKRITPLNLVCMTINLLEEHHEYLVMEYSMYRKFHVAELCRLVPPTAGVFLNIEASHIGVGDIQSQLDIFEAKRPLLDTAEYSFVFDDVLKIAGHKKPKDWKVLRVTKTIVFGKRGFTLRPFILTDLAIRQSVTAVTVVQKLLAITEEKELFVACLAIRDFRPKENRLSVFQRNKRTVIFDGEMTNSSRLLQLSQNFYRTRSLVILDVHFGDEPLVPQVEKLHQLVKKFDSVWVFTGLRQRYKAFILDTLDREPNVVLFDNLIRMTKEVGTPDALFIHHGGYWRFDSHMYEKEDLFEIFE